MVMPGRAFTSSSACAARVPLPRGRPRRPLPDAAAAAAPAGVRGARGGGCGAPLVPTPESARSAASRRVVLLDQRLELLEPRLDLLALLVEEVCHLRGLSVSELQIDSTHLPVKVALPGPVLQEGLHRIPGILGLEQV